MTPEYDDIPRTAGGSPVSAHGLSWKAAAAVLVVLLGLAASWGALTTQIDTVLQEVQGLHDTVGRQGEWIAGAKVRLHRVETDLDALKRRGR